jgi:ABC-type amino acid transport substrate-binding protein
MPSSSRLILAATFAVSVTLSGSASAADKIKIGFFSTLEGPYTALGEDGQRGFDLAVMQHHNKAGGKDLEIIMSNITKRLPRSAKTIPSSTLRFSASRLITAHSAVRSPSAFGSR